MCGPTGCQEFYREWVEDAEFLRQRRKLLRQRKKSVRLIQQCPVFMGFWNQGKQEFMMACTSVVFSAVLIAK